ncbi:phytoene desaturase family protein [Catellatospora sp. TT07R-123]|uniref:phytoene desaturase family protein n=1 Tax=Catellatospora sp. TT07R-123 TaxID=2733863 RepID=UPI001BB39ACF|nr:phytoene desaturase family protein [Catellatospora sp. TT07R-123]
MRTVLGPTNHVVVVGAGLGGLACALHLAGAGREVTVLERNGHPGGQVGVLELDGHRFDTGPTMVTSPELLAEPLHAVGEHLQDWIELIRLDPAYRAHFPDGTTLDVHADPERMVAAIARLCGGKEAAGYLRFLRWARRLQSFERRDPAGHWRTLASEGARRRLTDFFADPRTQRLFAFRNLLTGRDPRVASYLDTVTEVWYPRGGMNAVPRALAAAAEKHGVSFRFHTEVTAVETRGDRAVAVHTADGERLTADAVVLNPDLPAAYGLLPGGAPTRIRRLRPAPSCVVLHLGTRDDRGGYQRIAHHNLHFGRSWRQTFDEVVNRGELMSDPSVLVTNPSRTDPGAAPTGRQTYQVTVPVPNLKTAPVRWDGPVGRRYAGELMATLEARGYLDLGADLALSYVVTPDDWARQGMTFGTPFASAHTLRQTGPLRPGNLHPTLTNVVFTGSGTRPGVGVPMVLISGRAAARRVIGARS